MSVAFIVSAAVTAGAPCGALRGSRVRDCRARVTTTCEQVTTDPHAVCASCADQFDGFLADDTNAPF